MLTNDDYQKEIVAELLNNKYEIDFVSIRLFNEKTSRCGQGYVFQNGEGNFFLKFFSDNKITQIERFELFFDDSAVIDSYKLEAEDQNGVVYKCGLVTSKTQVDNISIYSFDSEIYTSKHLGYQSRFVFTGNYSLPSNGLSSSKTTVNNCFYYTDNQKIWEFELTVNVRLVFSKYKNYTELIILQDDNFETYEQFSHDIIDTLNFVLGIEVEPIYLNIVNQGQFFKNRRNMLQAKSTFNSPLVANHNHGIEFTKNHSNLFKLYFNYLNNNRNCTLPKIHKRIVSGSRNYLYASGLILSVQIESICKTYYKEDYKSNTEFIAAVEESISIMKQSTTILPTKYKDDIISRLCNMIPKNSDKPNVKNILLNLAERKVIDKVLISSWISLRSLTAHGDEYPEQDWKKFLNNIFDCTNLYYQLIFNLINYQGSYSYYNSDKNWIDRNYPNNCSQ